MSLTDNEFLEKLKKKYPLEHIEKEIEKIQKLGYTVVASESQCLIWEGEKLIIDSDFEDDFHSNTVLAIHSFYYEK